MRVETEVALYGNSRRAGLVIRGVAGLCVSQPEIVMVGGGLSCTAETLLVTFRPGHQPVRDVLLVPEVNAGWAGWCMIWVGSAETGCPAVKSRPPIVAAGRMEQRWPSLKPSAMPLHPPNQVAFVMIDGRSRIPTYASRSLSPEAYVRRLSVKINGTILPKCPQNLHASRPELQRQEALPQRTLASGGGIESRSRLKCRFGV